MIRDVAGFPMRLALLALAVIALGIAAGAAYAHHAADVGAWHQDGRRPAGTPTAFEDRVDDWRIDDRRPAPWPGKGADSDGDGVLDADDRCPDTPRGAVVDSRGCPLDGDADGVFDGLDRCPDTPRGATVDAQGCPSDSDGDGVFDGLDRCPDTPRGTPVNAQGCPRDSDGDGVPDDRDKCPNTPAGTRVDIRGCPMSAGEAELIDAGRLRLNILFDTNKSTLRPESYAHLDEVGEILAKRTDIRLEVGGHTDSQGEEAYNQSLSQARTEAVITYWRTKFPGIPAGNLVAKGYGESKPVATNDTREGRQQNRRVEITVLNPEVLR